VALRHCTSGKLSPVAMEDKQADYVFCFSQVPSPARALHSMTTSPASHPQPFTARPRPQRPVPSPSQHSHVPSVPSPALHGTATSPASRPQPFTARPRPQRPQPCTHMTISAGFGRAHPKPPSSLQSETSTTLI